jgi:hypothetical protein
MLASPSECSEFRTSAAALRRAAPSSRGWPPAQSNSVELVSPVIGWTIPLRRFYGRAGFRNQPGKAHSQVSNPSSRRVSPPLRSLAERILAAFAEATCGSSHGLSFPTAHEAAKVHQLRALPARDVPSSGFDYPLDGLLPSLPRRLFFAPAALVGFTLRSFLQSQGNDAFRRR